ncbi:MAG: DJ-1/PfpI family protein [Candidatus Bipolaricaulota bacterium]
MSDRQTRSPRVLLLAGDRVGANCTSDRGKLSILEKFRRYGWTITLAGAERIVSPCAFAAKLGAVPLEMDCTVNELGPILDYDVVSVLPAPHHEGLCRSAAVLDLLREASAADLVVSSWCHGIRVLAAADVIRGKRVVAHAADREAVEAAGGIFVGHDHPPVVDGRLVTGARSYYYRAKNAEAIRCALRARLGERDR